MNLGDHRNADFISTIRVLAADVVGKVSFRFKILETDADIYRPTLVTLVHLWYVA